MQDARRCARTIHLAHRSKCPTDEWHDAVSPELARLALRAPGNPATCHVRAVHVGANKGFKVASFEARYRRLRLGSRPISAEAWHKAISAATQRGIVSACGMCQDCRASLPRVRHGCSTEVHAFELLDANVRLLRDAFASFGVRGSVTHAAVGNMTGVAFTRDPKGRPGEEGASAKTRRSGPHSSAVRALTLDGWAEESGVRRIHELTIDAEGWDALVLEGAERLLSRRAVDLLEFEYNDRGKWSIGLRDRRYLKRVLAQLHGLGYGCFWQAGLNRTDRTPLGIARANGPDGWCEQLAAERPFWSNLVCSWQPAVLATLHRLATGYSG